MYCTLWMKGHEKKIPEGLIWVLLKKFHHTWTLHQTLFTRSQNPPNTGTRCMFEIFEKTLKHPNRTSSTSAYTCSRRESTATITNVGPTKACLIECSMDNPLTFQFTKKLWNTLTGSTGAYACGSRESMAALPAQGRRRLLDRMDFF